MGVHWQACWFVGGIWFSVATWSPHISQMAKFYSCFYRHKRHFQMTASATRMQRLNTPCRLEPPVWVWSSTLLVTVHISFVYQELEVHEAKCGFIPGSQDQNASRVRRRYRLVKGGHPQLVLVHYTRGQPARKFALRYIICRATFVADFQAFSLPLKSHCARTCKSTRTRLSTQTHQRTANVCHWWQNWAESLSPRLLYAWTFISPTNASDRDRHGNEHEPAASYVGSSK